jgi:pyrimidine deaminase RibD-like protein
MPDVLRTREWFDERDTERTQDQLDTHFMELALRQAETAASEGQTPFGAVVLDAQGHLIGEGHNRVRADLDPTAHGEVVAIRAAWRRLGAWPMLTGGTLSAAGTMPALLVRHHAGRLAAGGICGRRDRCAHLQTTPRHRPDGSGGLGERAGRLGAP